MDNKQKILEHFNGNFREFYDQYLELEPLKNSQNWSYKTTCPFHQGDSKASFKIDKNGNYKCFGCDAHGDIFDFYAKQNGLNTGDDFPQVLEEIAGDFGIQISQNGGGKNIDYIPEEIVQKLHENLTGDAKVEFLKQVRGLSQNVIEEYKLGFDSDRYTIPVWTRSGKVLDIRRYGPRKDAKLLPWKTFRDKDQADKWDIEMEWIEFEEEDKKDHWEPVIKGNGGSRAIYPIDQLDNEEILICEGPMDALKAISDGFNGVTNTCGVNGWRDNWNRHLRDKRVVLALDNDDAGEEETLKRTKQLTDVESLKVIDWPEDFQDGGDVTDYLIKNEPEDLIQLAELRKPGSDTEPISLRKAKDTFHKWLYMEDDSFIDAVLGAHLTTEMAGDPVWLFLVAPPGSGKTEILRTLKDEPGAYSVDQMTNKTLVSGNKKEESSLAPKIHEKTFIIKDFGPILSLKYEQRNEIFNDLRTAYDGYIEKEFGNQAEPKRFDTHFSLLVGSTPEIDKHSSLQSQLGERFLKLRIDIDTKETREQIVQKAMQNVDSHAAMRKELKEAVKGILAGVETGYEVEFSKNRLDQIGKMALFLAYCRTGVSRDRYDKTLDYLPESESGARPANQLKKMAMGISWLHGKKEVTNEVLEILRKVTVGSIPVKRARIIFTLVNSGDWMKTSPIAENTNVHRKTVERSLNDLADIGLIRKEKKNYWQWKIEDRIRAYAQDAGLSYSHGNFEVGTEEEVPF